MTRRDYMLFLLAEECSELALMASKCARFGFSEVKPGEVLDNEERLALEYCDVLAVIALLVGEGFIKTTPFDVTELRIRCKLDKVKRFYEYSQSLGLVE